MPENLLELLNLCLLALLYLFFLRVLWAVWTEVRQPRMARVTTSGRVKTGKVSRRTPSRLIVLSPPEQRGHTFEIGAELTVGRAGGCGVALSDDTYVSQVHARVYQRDGHAFVEDLGSTNGTYLNGARVSSPATLHRGDKLQVGTTVMEAT
ncbi:MAG TPA: FHA domain-containing protein [Acidimicrobiales bacterium]